MAERRFQVGDSASPIFLVYSDSDLGFRERPSVWLVQNPPVDGSEFHPIEDGRTGDHCFCIAMGSDCAEQLADLGTAISAALRHLKDGAN